MEWLVPQIDGVSARMCEHIVDVSVPQVGQLVERPKITSQGRILQRTVRQTLGALVDAQQVEHGSEKKKKNLANSLEARGERSGGKDGCGGIVPSTSSAREKCRRSSKPELPLVPRAEETGNSEYEWSCQWLFVLDFWPVYYILLNMFFVYRRTMCAAPCECWLFFFEQLSSEHTVEGSSTIRREP